MIYPEITLVEYSLLNSATQHRLNDGLTLPSFSFFSQINKKNGSLVDYPSTKPIKDSGDT